VPYVDTRKAEELFGHRVLGLLKSKELLSEERLELLLSWRRSGFSADDSVRIPASDRTTLEHVPRYILRCPVSLSRMRWAPGEPDVFYARRTIQKTSRAKGKTSRRWSSWRVSSRSFPSPGDICSFITGTIRTSPGDGA
jgi:hypothetical protein